MKVEKNLNGGDLFYVIEDYTTLTDEDIIKELKKLINSEIYISSAKKYQKEIDEAINAINNAEFIKRLYEQQQLAYNLLIPILFDESGKEFNFDWE